MSATVLAGAIELLDADNSTSDPSDVTLKGLAPVTPSPHYRMGNSSAWNGLTKLVKNFPAVRITLAYDFGSPADTKPLSLLLIWSQTSDPWTGFPTVGMVTEQFKIPPYHIMGGNFPPIFWVNRKRRGDYLTIMLINDSELEAPIALDLNTYLLGADVEDDDSQLHEMVPLYDLWWNPKSVAGTGSVTEVVLEGLRPGSLILMLSSTQLPGSPGLTVIHKSTDSGPALFRSAKVVPAAASGAFYGELVVPVVTASVGVSYTNGVSAAAVTLRAYWTAEKLPEGAYNATGPVAATAGENLLTSILAKVTNIPSSPATEGGNLATIAGKDFATQTTLSTASGYLGNLVTAIGSASAGLLFDIATRLTRVARAAAWPSDGIPALVGMDDAGNARPVRVDTDGTLLSLGQVAPPAHGISHTLTDNFAALLFTIQVGKWYMVTIHGGDPVCLNFDGDTPGRATDAPFYPDTKFRFRARATAIYGRLYEDDTESPLIFCQPCDGGTVA